MITSVIGNPNFKFSVSFCEICKYFEGEDKGTCPAYPNGIPDRFSLERDIHDEKDPDQVGDFLFTHI
jgi:hypothetical protein